VVADAVHRQPVSVTGIPYNSEKNSEFAKASLSEQLHHAIFDDGTAPCEKFPRPPNREFFGKSSEI